MRLKNENGAALTTPLVSIVVTTLIGWMLGDVKYGGLFSLPPSITSVVGQVDVAGALNIGLAGVIFSFMLVNLFDSSGTLIGVTNRAKLADDKGHFPRMKQALVVDSVSSVGGAFMGTSSVTAYIESSSGVAVGGRTGLTAIVVAALTPFVLDRDAPTIRGQASTADFFVDGVRDDAQVRAALDLSGRPYLVWNVAFPTAKIGAFDTELVREFFQAFAMNAGMYHPDFSPVGLFRADGVEKGALVTAGAARTGASTARAASAVSATTYAVASPASCESERCTAAMPRAATVAAVSPLSAKTGLPLGSDATSMSVQWTPSEPPSALMSASFAA